MSPTQNSSLSQWLQYIEAIHPVEIDLGLERLKVVADRLLTSNAKPFVFTVAGTNGKGTTTAAIASLAQSAGLSVGWYTSPHLFRFNERVRINGSEIDDEALSRAFHAVNIAREDISLSYFEFTTLAAFWAFEQEKLDVWVLEVGLGGRLDAVNIIEPDVSIITNVGLDHQNFLGDTLEAIGREKSGICRKNKPLVLGSVSFPESVLEFQRASAAQVFRFGDSHGVTKDRVFWQNGQLPIDSCTVPLPNASAALQAFSLSPYRITLPQIEQAFSAIDLAGRMQTVAHNGRKIVIDVGHNAHAASYISAQLGPIKHHILLGMLADKDPVAFVQALRPIAHSINVIGLDVPRGLTAEQLSNQLDMLEVKTFSSLKECMVYLDQHNPGEPLFIGGSFYTVCDALSYLEN